MVEVGDVMRRLVAVGVLPDKAGNIGLGPTAGLGTGPKQGVQQGLCALGTADGFDPSVYILRHIKRSLPSVGFGVMVVHLSGVKRGQPLPVLTRAHHSGHGVQQIAPRSGTAQVSLVALKITPQTSRLGQTPIIVGVFQIFGDRLRTGLHAEVSVIPQPSNALIILVGAMHHSFPS